MSVMDVRGETEAAYRSLESQPEVPPSSTSEVPDAPQAEAAPPAPATEESAPAQSQEPKLAGNIPVDRHQAVLTKTRQEYEQKLERLKWAEQYQDPQVVQQRLAIAELADRNPGEFLRQYVEAVRSNPQFANVIDEVLGGARQAPADDPMPEPDIPLADGRNVYSSDQMQRLLEWQEKRITNRFKPFEEERAATQAWNQALSQAAPKLEQMRRSWPGFADHQDEIRAVMAQQRASGRPVDVNEAYRTVVIPKLRTDEAKVRADERAKVLAELNAKPTVSPERPGAQAALPAGGPTRNARGQFVSSGDVARQVFQELSSRS